MGSLALMTSDSETVTHDGEDTNMKNADIDSDDREYPCLIRATDGKEIKFSTKVSFVSPWLR